LKIFSKYERVRSQRANSGEVEGGYPEKIEIFNVTQGEGESEILPAVVSAQSYRLTQLPKRPAAF